jgi:hypothetical protein
VVLASAAPEVLVPAHNALATLMKGLFDHDGAERYYRRALELASGNDQMVVLSNLLPNRCYHEDETGSNPRIYELAREWGERFAPRI